MICWAGGLGCLGLSLLSSMAIFTMWGEEEEEEEVLAPIYRIQSLQSSLQSSARERDNKTGSAGV